MTFISKYFPHILLAIYGIEFAVLSINPYARDVWFVENMTIVAIIIPIIILYVKGIRFSNTAYLFMFILPFMHTIGGHYTFEKVPFDWFNDMFGFERNMYDRVAHATVGLYAYPLAEYLLSKKKVASMFWANFTALCAIVTVAAFYELFEWQYAIMADAEAGIAVLGAQGDIWDAQKDMLMDTLGAVFALAVFTIKRKVL
ncbi:MAG: putative rane protein [Patescibacteria group bacterium]|nr:putative rane protein [Patescibacteria group bacterium]